jgi:SAM-dependent methyltransferase
MNDDSPQDERTAAFYRERAAELAARYETARPRLAERLAARLRSGARALDVGAGSGRDLAYLLSQGFDAYGVEPSPAILSEAVRRHPELAGRIAEGHLPDLGAPFGGRFEGVLLSAVLMHVPREELPRAAASLASLLEPGGYLLSSVAARRPGLDAEHRDERGRLFVPIDAAEIQALFGAAGLAVVDVAKTADDFGRPGYEWLEALLVKRR